MNITIAISFTTDKEAGAVYGTIRHLKREGFFSSYSMYDDYALILGVDDPETILNVFNDMADERELPGIFAQID